VFLRSCLIEFLAIAFLLCAADEQPLLPTGRAIRVAVAPIVDGVLDDAAWKDAPPLSDLRQKEPHAGATPSERTVIRVVYTSDALYVGVKCYESHPRSQWVVKQMGRDQSLYVDDRIEIGIDSFHDHRNGYQFVTNPAGGMMDSRMTENTKVAPQWDGIWYVKTSVDSDGWNAEFMIPFKTIAFDPKKSTWGFQFKRSMEHLYETAVWSWPRADGQMNNMALFGDIEGFQGLSQGVGLDIRPYGALGYTRDVTRNPMSDRQATGGADIFYRLTANTVATASINTDFSGTESDTRQINMTRFPTFFEEKRSFFLEDAGVFDFTPASNNDLLPFYSRRIGLVNGLEAPIDFGTKVSGTMGPITVGLLNVKSRDSDVAPGENFTVARMKASFWKQSYIGALYTHGDPTGRTNNTVGGLDMKLGTGDFLGTKKILGVTLFGLRSKTSTLKGNDFAWGGQISYPNDFLAMTYTNKWIEGNFNPGLGFLKRPGTHFTAYDIQIRPRPKNVFDVRQMTYEISYNSYYDLKYRDVASRSLKLVPLSWWFNKGSIFSAYFQGDFERLWESFTVNKRTNTRIAAGSYWMNRGVVSYSSPSKKPVQYSASYNFGDFYNGSSHSVDATIQWRKNEHLSTLFEVQQYWVQLSQRNFQTRLLMYKLAYNFSPLMTLSTFLQYDTDSRNVGVQSRLRWVLRPGTDVFFVVNHAWQDGAVQVNRWDSYATSVRLKFQHTFRF
jgi:hypothetical protein